MRNFTQPFTLHSSMKFYFFMAAVILFTVMSGQTVQAQQIAFPGAEGAGRFASGGRGTPTTATTVFEVTNLDDNTSAGSLRYALTQPAAWRTIIFRVSGTIHLNTNLNIPANTTIAGQTAPGDGICIADKAVSINGNNIIVRYIRFRLGDKNQQAVNGNDDALSGTGRKNIIIDHCTMGWSNDESFTIYSGDSTTAQWNIISEPLNFSYHDEGSGIQNHGYGGIWGGRKSSFHHNLIVHAIGRTPRFDGSRNLSPNTPGLENVDFRNNVIYNWASYNVNGGEGGNYNVVNNYYKYGPSTSTGTSAGVPVRFMVINPGQQTSAPVLPYGQYYLTGNYVDGSTVITEANWKGAAMSGGSLADTTLSKVTSPFDIGPVTTHTAQEAYDLVLQYAGASFARDTLDLRIINDVKNRTGRIIDVQGGYPHGTAYALTANAWPTLNSTTAPADTDHDGMSDAYETANGLNINDAADRNGYAGNGYTNLENYLNGIVEAATISVSSSLNAFTQNIPAASATQNYTISGANLSGDITITPPVNFQVSGDGGNTWYTNALPLTVNQSGGSVPPKTIHVRLNAAGAGNYSGDIANASTGANTLNIAVTGNAFASTAPPGTSLVVAQDGTGDYATVQAAINAAPTGLTAPYIIFIKNGKYREKITVPSNKPFIQLVGESVANVILYYDDAASTPAPGGGTLGTQNSASFTVNATDFSAFSITFSNTFGDGSQAVALLVNADRAVFKNCRFLGNQDTLYIKGGGTPKHYFKNCYIDGNVDFIFGSSVAAFDSCVIYPKSRTSTGNSYITAANTPAGQTYGYVFRDCIIPNNTGATQYVLGRPWQNSTGASPVANNKVVFLNTTMEASVKPEGWAIWDAGTNTSLIYYGEYQSKNFDGSPVNSSQRVPWSFQLTAIEAATYTNANLFGAWDPCAVSTGVCTSEARSIAIANFRGTKGASASMFNWNISWAMDQIKYELYRSATRSGGYTKVGEITAVNDTAVNFLLTDVIPVAGTSYYYYLVGSKTGYAAHVTDTVEISSVPTITTTGTLQPFIQNVGTPAASQNVNVSGENLLGDITITPPVNFDISTNGGTNWISNPAVINLSPANNTVAATVLAVRLHATAEGTYTDSIRLTTTGGETKYIKVTGTTAVIAPSTTITLLHWPFTTNGDDSAAVRATGVLPGTPTFNRLYLSNGTQVPAIPAYSTQFGQAFGATANGDGSWGTGAGGPGGTLRRTYYEQFTVTAGNGYAVRVDSIYVTAAFYNTSSNTRLAVVYSTSNFVSDSADVFTIPGGFANPASLLNQTAGPATEFPLSVAGLGGVTLQPGETLTFRLYFSCGSSSAGRYAMLKNVRVAGEAVSQAAVPGILQHWPFTTNGDDSAAVRSAGVAAGTPTFNNLYTSNGSVLPAYSPQYGQAFGATANGDGSWGTGAGGPGGTLRRTYYEQFTVTANSSYTVRVDSLFVTGAFYNTSSNTRLAVVYSLSNFVTDSADVSTIPGGFANPVALANQSGGPTNNYSLEVAPGGITLQPGQILTFRFYFSCSSSSVARFAMLKDVKVKGLATPVTAVAGVIQHWPFTTNGDDSAAVRSAGVTAGTPAFNKLYTSNGSVLPAYSTQYGQAFGATANGDGSWGTGAGGPGGTLNRTFYEQFTVTANSGYNVRVDSIYVTGAFYNTSSNTRLAVVYSISNFATDSTDVSTIPGGFANPVALANQSGGPTNTYALEVAGATGVTLLPGQTLTFRFYFSCSSSSVARFAMLKDVKVTGLVTTSTGPSPTIITTGTLNNFTQITGSPSPVQTYSVSGIDLTSGITITPPVDYEISADDGGTWYTSTSPLLLVQTGGVVTATTITVRLNATATGAHSGNIVHTGTGATTVNVAVNGNTVPPPAIAVTGTLNAFSHTVGTPSASQAYTISGTDLLSVVTITPPAGFEISGDSGTTWRTSTSPLVINPVSGAMPARDIYVRMNATAAGSISGDIINATGNADTILVAVSGAAIPAPVITISGTLNNFSQITGTPSAIQSYTISGANLTGNITITPPADYEISANGGTTWFNSTTPLTVIQNGGTLAATTITVRLNAGTLGAHTGTINHESSGAALKTIAVNGTTIPAPSVTVTSTFTPFEQTIGAPSAAKTYTVSGAALTGDITITPPAKFEISVNGGFTWSSLPVTLTRSNNALPVTTIGVRLNAGFTGRYSGNIVHVTAGAAAISVPVSGITKLKETFSVYPTLAVRTVFIAHPAMAEKAMLVFYNANGQQVAAYQASANSIETSIDISKFRNGLYYVEYLAANNKVMMKFIKQ